MSRWDIVDLRSKGKGTGQHGKRLVLTWKDLWEKRHHREEQTWVRERRVGLDGAQHASQYESRIQRVILELDADRGDVDEDVDLTRHQRVLVTRWMSEYRKRHQEEWTEVIKHLGEEIPPQSRVWGQVRERESAEDEPELTDALMRGVLKTHSTNHVCHIHWNPPEISVEVRLSATKWARNSRPTILPFPKLMEIGIGLARLDFGRPSNNIITGNTNKTEDSETCTSAARQKRAGEVFPSR